MTRMRDILAGAEVWIGLEGQRAIGARVGRTALGGLDKSVRPTPSRTVRLAVAVRGVALCTCLLMALTTWAATYYVDATGGVDSNDGLSPALAWKTIAKVNGSTFAAGDQILFKRGEVWRESLLAPSSGASGNPIVFDAYGTGEAPTITGALDLPESAWTQDTGNIWRATVTATGMNYVSFGGIWGTKRTGSKNNCTESRDFFFLSNTVYVYPL